VDPFDDLRRRWLAEASAAGRVSEARALDDDPDAVSAEEALAELLAEPDEPITSPWRSAA
jgi:hypothetical protein